MVLRASGPVMAVKGEHARQRIAVCGVARVADVHRPRRVGGHEFDQDALRRIRAASPKPLPRAERAGQCPQQP